MLKRKAIMQKILIMISLLLYWVGCGNGNRKLYIPETTHAQSAIEETGSQVEDGSGAATITAQTQPDHVSLTEIAALSLEGVALDIALSDDGRYAYIASGDFGLSVVDISDPYNPVLIDTIDTPQYANRVDVEGEKVYVRYKPQTWNDYVNVDAFDISDPAAPRLLGHYESFQNNDHKVASENGLDYYVDNQGLKVVRESDYRVIGRYDLFDTAYALALCDGYIFVANGRNGLTILKANGF